jgi:hypothetical protein
MNLPPVTTARSPIIALRRSPKPGAFTAQMFNTPRSLFTTSAASASASTSSAMISSGRPPVTTLFSNGSSSGRFEIFFSCSRTYAFSSTASSVVGFVRKYGLR